MDKIRGLLSWHLSFGNQVEKKLPYSFQVWVHQQQIKEYDLLNHCCIVSNYP
ncbi:hypothetical protein COLO4_28860 [Corchorus olitorius]|uniref:Uncharacterized protein n=1 Tax=Corchorus olitorius TaxID=93759 RepID=A0A1R3HHX7_9ROSI|nr:hypothetical protein COLO4_28860 [Corchorus olitorius]